LHQGRWWILPVVIVYWLGQVASVVLVAAFPLLTSWRLAADGAIASAVATTGIGIAFLTFFLVYAMVHFGSR
jgi:hypothetical protein